jgi:hypothetical protein
MRWVLDNNVGVKWLLQEDQSDKARIICGFSRFMSTRWIEGEPTYPEPVQQVVDCLH